MRRMCFPVIVAVLAAILLSPAPMAYAEETSGQDDIYDALEERIRDSWDSGIEELETENEIEIKGSITERMIRSIANIFYRHLTEIKAWSLMIGLISMLCGFFIAVTSKLNKKLRRFAIVALIITIPGILTGFVFGITKLISIFI